MLLLVSHCDIFHLNIFANHESGTSTGSSSDSGSAIPVIAGATGGTVLFFIVLFCVVFFCCKLLRTRKKESYAISTVYSHAAAHSKGLNKNFVKYLYFSICHKETNTPTASSTLYPSMEAELQPSTSKKGLRKD